MKYEVIVSPLALGQFSALVDWWTQNRPDSRTDLIGEFEKATVHMGGSPYAAPRYERNGRYLTYGIKGTPYVLFYRVDDRRGRVYVVAAWSGQRGDGPRLP